MPQIKLHFNFSFTHIRRDQELKVQGHNSAGGILHTAAFEYQAVLFWYTLHANIDNMWYTIAKSCTDVLMSANVTGHLCFSLLMQNGYMIRLISVLPCCISILSIVLNSIIEDRVLSYNANPFSDVI